MTRKGVWNLQQVRDKYLQSLWEQSYSLFSWGRNDNMGGLGHNNITAISSPKQVGSQTDWKSVTAGGLGVFLGTKTDGTLWVSGGGAPSSGNTYGQLGLNSRAGYSSPVQVPGTTWDVVGSADSSTLALKTDGTLWSWGSGAYGSLGHGSFTPTLRYSSPVQIGSDTTWQHLSGGKGLFAAIKTDGTIWSWGYGSQGQLGLNDKTTYSSPKQIPGTNWNTLQIVANQYGYAALKTDGTAWGWGRNYLGGLGVNVDGSTTGAFSSPTQIAATDGWIGAMTGVGVYVGAGLRSL